MGLQIEGNSSGNIAGVDNKGRLATNAIANSVQHTVSHDEGQAYQVIGVSTLASGTVTALHIKNNSTTKNVVITYIRHQVIDPTAGASGSIPNVSNYFQMSLGRTYDSGGTAATPVNLNTASGNAADVTCYTDTPTMAGSPSEIDRQYTKAAGDMNSFNKEGSVILGPNGTFECAYIGDATVGIIYARVSFLMQDMDS